MSTASSRLPVLFVFAFILLVGCGSTSKPSLPPGAPPVPTASDPWFGSAGNVLISDRGFNQTGSINYLWVGFNSSQNWQSFLALHQRLPNGGWIGGHVVVEPRSPLGFYFDPSTTASGEITAEALQTDLAGIKQNPGQYANGFAWYVVPVVEQVR